MNNKLTLERFTGILFFVFLNFATVLSLSQFNTEGLGRLVIRIFILCSGIALIFNYMQLRKIKLSSLLMILTFLTISSLSYMITRNFLLTMMAMVFMIAKGLKYEQLLKYNILTLALGFSFIVFTSLLGVTDMSFHEVMKNDVSLTVYRLGFGNPNSPPAVIFAIVTGYNLLKKSKLNTKELFIEFLIAYAVFRIFGSRTGAFVLSGYVISIFLVQKFSHFKAIKYIMAPWQYFFLFGTLLMVYVVYNYSGNDATWHDINFLLSGRLYTWKSLVDYYGVHSFGADMSSLTVGLDNGYLYLLMYSGVISLVIYNFVFLRVSAAAFKRENWIWLLTIIAYDTYGFFESTPLFSSVCNILLIFGWLIIGENKTAR